MVFAGHELPGVMPGADLALCVACGLYFKFPAPDKAALDRLYLDAAGDTWQAPPDSRIDWQLAVRHLENHARGDVLDIGCFDGRFLGMLPPHWRKYGIEISEWGAAESAARGIDVIGRDFSALQHYPVRFSAITAFDVIEHVHHPDVLLSECWRALLPGGLLVVATGDASSLPWKLHKERNLYCICPEHLVFLTPKWMSAAAGRHGFTLRVLEKYRRTSATVGRMAREYLANYLFAVSPSLVAALAGMGGGRARSAVTKHHPPLWSSVRDHMFVVLQKDLQ